MGTNPNQVNDILQIRELIFGENIKKYEQRFQELEKKMTSVQAQVDTLKTSMETANKKSLSENQNEFQRLREEINNRFEEFSQLKMNREALRSFLTELGSKIKENTGQ